MRNLNDAVTSREDDLQFFFPAFRKHFPDMYDYIRPFNKSNVIEGISAVKKG
jgi:hypothetical protein